MCGRYNIDFDDEEEIRDIIQQVDRKIQSMGESSTYSMKLGDVYPTDLAPIVLERNKKQEAELAAWGFPNFNRKGVIINARAETVTEKPMFRDCMVSRRCIVPSTGFYEWDEKKRKYFIRRPGTKALYMAGVYSFFQDKLSNFVILTTNANESMQVIHDRMPILLPKEELEDWLFDDAYAKKLLTKTMPEVELKLQEAAYEQLSLFD